MLSGFNSRTLGRVRRLPPFVAGCCSGFNSRTLGRVRRIILRPCQTQRCFNSRTLGRVRPEFSIGTNLPMMFQFTHPGKGATSLLDRREKRCPVSIHAPWEGCDFSSFCSPISSHLFQFTHPGKGATHARRLPHNDRRRFNSRTLGRVRQILCD